MASMMGGDFVEAYVLKNAYKEKFKRLEAAEETKKSTQSFAEKDTSGGGGGGSSRGGLFRLIKKKQVHPKAAALSAAIGTGHGASF